MVILGRVAYVSFGYEVWAAYDRASITTDSYSYKRQTMKHADKKIEFNHANCATRKISGELFECFNHAKFFCGYGLNFGNARYCKHANAGSFLAISPKPADNAKPPTKEITL